MAAGPFRLIGIGMSELQPGLHADKGDLIDTAIGRDKALDGAIDALRTRFGDGSIERGITFAAPRR